MVRFCPVSTAYLSDMDCTANLDRETSQGERVAVIATEPLTKDEDWKEFCKGHLLMFDRVLPYSELYDCGEVKREGSGLSGLAFRSLCAHMAGIEPSPEMVDKEGG